MRRTSASHSPVGRACCCCASISTRPERYSATVLQALRWIALALLAAVLAGPPAGAGVATRIGPRRAPMWNFPLCPDRASSLATPRRRAFLRHGWPWRRSWRSAVAVLIVFFSIRYRRGSSANRAPAPEAARARRDRRIEIAWIFVPLGLFFGMFAWAAELYYEHTRPAGDAMTVYVVGKQWMWKLEHAGGRREIDELHVPLGRPVRLMMTSQDVIHSFFVPAFRIKQDVLPGRYTTLWFTRDEAGRLPPVLRRVLRHRPLADGRPRRRHAAGRLRALARARQRQPSHGRSAALRASAQLGCSGCHGASASVHAPTLDGLFGRHGAAAGRPHRRSPTSATCATRSCCRSKDVVAGYAPIMPSFAGPDHRGRPARHHRVHQVADSDAQRGTVR